VKFAILGSGFGFYGYLPALIEGCGQEVVLPERYRSQLTARPDVGYLTERVEWARDEDVALAGADGIIVTRRPEDQVRCVADILDRGNIERLVLEKPLAPSPGEAKRITQSLAASGKTYRIGYIFRYTEWGKQLLALEKHRRLGGRLEIVWSFQAHHYLAGADNWKRHISAGGGALRFFGIHLVALLAELGYRDVSFSRLGADVQDEAEVWDAAVIGPGLPECRVHVDSRAAARRFAIRPLDREDSFPEVTLAEPFAAVSAGKLDIRVSVLSRFCRDLLEASEMSCPWYERTVALWDKLEAASDHVPSATLR